MIKYILIASLLVHLALLSEVVPERTEASTTNADVPKKYYKKESHTEHYDQRDQYERKSKHKKYYDDENKYSVDEGDKKYYKEKPKKNYEEKKYKQGRHGDDKNYEGRKRREESARMIADAGHDVVSHPASSLTKDVDVNKNFQGLRHNPDSEVVASKYVKKDFYKEMKKIDLSNPPKPNDTVLMARYIVHNVGWSAMATIASHSGGKHGPFATIVSMSDGPEDQSSGVPFFYITPKDLATQDVEKDGRASITVTLAETPYCQQENLDPEDPRCARVTLSGKIKRVKLGTPEEDFAREALFTRHPVMKTWPQDHGFYLAKLKISQIVLLDRFGGPTYINVMQYLSGGDEPSV